MMKVAVYMLVSMVLTLGLSALVSMLGFFSTHSNISKNTPFECGFTMLSMTGLPLSMPFFIVSLVFLLFDVEILLVCLYPLMKEVSTLTAVAYWVVLLMVLAATLYEWKGGLLSWL